ncbi:MAG TPA: exosortase/archaeosortase family protein [Terriglobia bacterium]|nr:exosortase/archaeosortase family protein [Terriglobia bacterium]
MRRRNLYFILFVAVPAASCGPLLGSWAELSLHNNSYSHLLLIPLITGALVYLERRRIFSEVRYSLGAGTVALLAAGAAGLLVSSESAFSLDPADRLTLTMLSLVLIWIAGFIVCYGFCAFRTAIFPLLFLLLMVPFPPFLLNKIIFALRKGSAECTAAIFRLTGMPYFMNGFEFSLPGLNIEIARECSGIRSSLALFIVSLLAGHVFLRSAWRKASLVLFIIPLVVVKNALRIATISLLSVYVDRSFIHGDLHRYSGIPFSIVSLALLIPFLWWLQRSENREAQPPAAPPALPGTALAVTQVEP